MSSKAGFTVIEHTADTGIKFYGETFSEIYENAAKGMSSLITDRRTVKPIKEKIFIIEGKDYEELTINWLRELHYFHQSELFLFRKFKFNKLSGKERNFTVSSTAFGENINLNRHKIKNEIKLVTYHKFYVKKIENYWEGLVIFDI